MDGVAYLRITIPEELEWEAPCKNSGSRDGWRPAGCRRVPEWWEREGTFKCVTPRELSTTSNAAVTVHEDEEN
jgi:hypothetical protein